MWNVKIGQLYEGPILSSSFKLLSCVHYIRSFFAQPSVVSLNLYTCQNDAIVVQNLTEDLVELSIPLEVNQVGYADDLLRIMYHH